MMTTKISVLCYNIIPPEISVLRHKLWFSHQLLTNLASTVCLSSQVLILYQTMAHDLRRKQLQEVLSKNHPKILMTAHLVESVVLQYLFFCFVCFRHDILIQFFFLSSSFSQWRPWSSKSYLTNIFAKNIKTSLVEDLWVMA